MLYVFNFSMGQTGKPESSKALAALKLSKEKIT